jgi:hypothetical protein
VRGCRGPLRSLGKGDAHLSAAVFTWDGGSLRGLGQLLADQRLNDGSSRIGLKSESLRASARNSSDMDRAPHVSGRVWSGSVGLQRRGASVPGGLVLLDDAGRYAAAVGQLDLVGRGSGPDSLEVHVAAGLGRPASPASSAALIHGPSSSRSFLAFFSLRSSS